MEVFALFDNGSSEKVNLDFLQPHSRGDRVEITFLHCISDNIKESVDKGIKEAFFSTLNYSKSIPEKISVLYRGFEGDVRGNSCDLAFSVSLVAHMIEEGYLKVYNSPQKIAVTGVINKYGEIKRITGLKEKIEAALKLCDNSPNTMLIFPAENSDELSNVILLDENINQQVRRSRLKLVPVRKLDDIYSVFGVRKKSRQRVINYVRTSAIVVILALTFLFFLFRESIFANNTVTKGSNDIETKVSPANKINNKASDKSRINISKDNVSNIGGQNASVTPPEGKSGKGSPSKEKTSDKKKENSNISTSYFIQKTTDHVNILENSIQCMNVTKTADIENNTVKYRIEVAFNKRGLKEGLNFENITVKKNVKTANIDNARVVIKTISDDRSKLILNVWLPYGGDWVFNSTPEDERYFTVIIPDGALSDNEGKPNLHYLIGLDSKSDIYTYRKNLVVNGSFEGGLLNEDYNVFTDPIGWKIDVLDGQYDVRYILNDIAGKSGQTAMKIVGKDKFRVYVSQTVNRLKNGVYTLNAWVQTNGPVNAFMEARDLGHESQTINIPQRPGQWEKISLGRIQVVSGKCTVGFWAETNNSQDWIAFDDVELVMTNDTIP